MLQALKSGSAAIFLALLGAGVAVIADHRTLALYLCAAGAAFGLVTIVTHFIDEIAFHRVRDGLGQLLIEGDTLAYESITNADEFSAWKTHLNDWFNRTS